MAGGTWIGTFDPFVIVGTDDPTVIHKTTGLEWQKSFANELTWQQSIAYCETLDYAGHTNWRLPNVKELQSLINVETISRAVGQCLLEKSVRWSVHYVY